MSVKSLQGRRTTYATRIKLMKLKVQNTTYVWKRMFTKFDEITQCNDHYAVQDHLRSPILVSISYTTSYSD